MTVITAFLLRFRLSFLLSTSRFVTHTALVSEIMQFYGRGGCYWPSAQGRRTRGSNLDWSLPGVQNSSRHSSESHKSGGDLIRVSFTIELTISSTLKYYILSIQWTITSFFCWITNQSQLGRIIVLLVKTQNFKMYLHHHVPVNPAV